MTNNDLLSDAKFSSPQTVYKCDDGITYTKNN